MKAAESDRRDLHVLPLDALDAAHAAKFSKPWLTQTPDGGITEHDTEEEACRVQRVYRLAHGLNPFSGDPLDLDDFIQKAKRILAPSILDLSRETADNAMAKPFHTKFKVVIIPSTGNPPGRLAEAELHFVGGILHGLKLVGFAVWERRGSNGLNVTFPARTYAVNGERRSYAVLRPINNADTNAMRGAVVAAYIDFEEAIEPGSKAKRLAAAEARS